MTSAPHPDRKSLEGTGQLCGNGSHAVHNGTLHDLMSRCVIFRLRLTLPGRLRSRMESFDSGVGAQQWKLAPELHLIGQAAVAWGWSRRQFGGMRLHVVLKTPMQTTRRCSGTTPSWLI